MQCPACGMSASTADFGQPPKCPDCQAYYDKALIARAQRVALEADREIKAQREQVRAARWQRLSAFREQLSSRIARLAFFGGGELTTGGLIALGLVCLVAVIYVSAPSRPSLAPAVSSTPEQNSVALSRQKVDEDTEWKLRVIGENAVKARLRDPDSASFRNQFVGRSGIPCGEVNSKNGFGGHTGYQRYMASGGGLVFLEEEVKSEEFEGAWMQLCR